MNQLFAKNALLPDGWARDVLVAWDADGTLTAVRPGASCVDIPTVDYVLPGMVNLHSHTFQRALGGLTERAASTSDSFWTWRDLMYRFAATITPEQVQAIAAQLFVDCLRHGYTALCEFHYLHHGPDGVAYARPAEMAERVAAAAQESGIGLTLLPVLYSHAGFGAQPLKPEQQRFRTDTHAVLERVQALAPLRSSQLEVGAAPHSLRAAAIDQVRELVREMPPARPLHIHIAEQQAEVDQCLAFTGQRPVDYLLSQIDVDARWCLVHATHLTGSETARLAASGAVAGLCPTTEANLGDGLFPLADYIAAGGVFGVGSDSHVSHSPVEELRWLEYGQRLAGQRRNVAATPATPDVAAFLWQGALRGGALATGRPVGALAPGKRADLLVLEADHVNLDGIAASDVLGRFLFSGNDNLVRDVLAGGRWVVKNGVHIAQSAVAHRYKLAIHQLREVSR
jgi:formimidoylglutamate deiminase